MLASTRERRGNAGAKMAHLLESEDLLDDFYKTTYGGFEEDQVDAGFESPHHSDSDSVDSDFDISESDEEDAGNDDGEEKTIRKRRVVTKAYKEPVRKRPATDSISRVIHKRQRQSFEDRPEIREKRLRSSTLQKSAETSSVRWSDLPQKQGTWRRNRHCQLSQQELLKEAKLTEKLNLQSLAHHQQWELEQKKKRQKVNKKREVEGPKIKYISVRMPAKPETSQNIQSTGWTAGDGSDSYSTKYYSRTFVQFSDGTGTGTKLLGHFFPSNVNKPKRKEKALCVVTGHVAKYKDSITGLPYANSEAFRAIRDAYEKHLIKNGNSNDPAVADWLRWRQST